MKWRRARRFVLAAIVAVGFACYGVHMDETQIRSIAAQDLDCDPALVSLETESSSRKDVGRYEARGCERVRTYECTTDDNGRVTCSSVFKKSSGGEGDSDGTGEAVATAAAAGCACASLLGSKSSGSSSGSGGSNPNSTTPQRNR